MPDEYFVHPSSVVDEGAQIGAGSRIWHFCHIMPGARIGKRCNFGQNCFVANGVVVGDDVKVQNNVSLYEGVELEADVFLGPSCVLTNVGNPRSQVDRRSLYERTLVRRGASVGANATIVCGTTVGRYAFVGAGAVVTQDVPDYAVVVGVPAKQIGWISRHGHRMQADEEGRYVCPESGLRYTEESGVLRCVDVAEEDPLPAEHRVGRATRDAFRRT